MFKVKDLITERIKLSEVFDEARRKQIAEEYGLKTNGETEFIRKGYVNKDEDMEIKDGERAVIKYVNTATVDRDGEIVMPDGADLKEFRKNPVVLFAHDYGSLPIGRDQWIKVDGWGIKAKTIYASAQANPFAEQVYQLNREKILKTSSVGFIPLEVFERGTDDYEKSIKKIKTNYGIPESESRKASRIYAKWILLEHSDCPVPTNPDAYNLAISKGMDISEQMKEQISEYLEIEETPEPDIENEHLDGEYKERLDELAVLRTLSQKQTEQIAMQRGLIDHLSERLYDPDSILSAGTEPDDEKSSIFPIAETRSDSVQTIPIGKLKILMEKRESKIIDIVGKLIALKSGKAV